MKEVSISTFCNNMWHVNYGQVLQCYAMQEIFKKMNFDVKVVRYREKNDKDILKYKLPFGKLNEIYENYCQKKILKYGKKVNEFQKFMKENVNLTYPCYSIKDVEKVTKNSDVLVCGSDQIWNPASINEFYSLDFGSKNQKRIAYATSGIIAENRYSIKKYIKLGKVLNNFDAVALREKSGVDILQKYTEKNITDVLDPTFLLDAKEWDKVADKRLIKEPYIFCYALRGIRPYKMILKKISEYQGNKKIVFIEPSLSPSKCSDKFVKISDAGPSKFLSLIKYADMVCTDSFHGIALSINYKKQFVTFTNKVKDMFIYSDRQKNILEKCNINNRTCDSLKDIDKLEPIDYKAVEKNLERERCLSWEFLESAIEIKNRKK